MEFSNDHTPLEYLTTSNGILKYLKALSRQKAKGGKICIQIFWRQHQTYILSQLLR